MGSSAIHESGHFYFAQTGHSHFAPTISARPLANSRIPVYLIPTSFPSALGFGSFL
jgi:hypothetical protein